MANSRRNPFLKNYCFILFLIIFAYSCVNKDDYDFNYDKVKQMYEETYPVKKFDENQDWKTTKQINLNVTINEDALEEYKIKVYDACPYGDSIDVHKLVEGDLSNGESIDLKFDCPKLIKALWVSRIDSHKRRVVKPILIDDSDSYFISFGENINISRSSVTRSTALFDKISCPFTENQVNDMLRDAKEVPSGKNIASNNGVFSDNGYYKLPNDVNKYDFVYNGSYRNQKCYFIIDREITFHGDINVTNGNLTLIITKDGVVKNTNINVIGSNIVVMPGGKIEATNNNISMINATSFKYSYNGGTINASRIYLNGYGGLFCNNGIINISNFYSDTASVLQNQASITIDEMLAPFGILNNSCCIFCKNNSYFRIYNLDENSCVECGFFNNGNNNDYVVYMSKNSVLNCTNSFNNFVRLIGPSVGYSLIKLGSMEYYYGIDYYNSFGIINNVYCEISNWAVVSKYTLINMLNNRYLYGGGTLNACIMSPGESPISIPNGDCTGSGNIPSEEGDDEDDEERNVYTYCYEDYYPYPGDYDFNDIVMDMSYDLVYNNKNITNVNMNIDLAAVGASYQLGAALQLIGIDKGKIKSVTVSGNKMRNTGLFDTKDNESNNNTNFIIPLFDDAHYQLKGVSVSGLLNTMQGHEGYADANKSRITVNIKFNKGITSFGLDNLDLFVARNLLGGYYGGQKDRDRIEIHLYQFWDNKTIRAVDFDKNEEAAAKRTWAICVPNFKYPYEYVPIYNLQNGELNNKECAYPDFGTWAANRNDAQDWYQHPNSGTTYR